MPPPPQSLPVRDLGVLEEGGLNFPFLVTGSGVVCRFLVSHGSLHRCKPLVSFRAGLWTVQRTGGRSFLPHKNPRPGPDEAAAASRASSCSAVTGAEGLGSSTPLLFTPASSLGGPERLSRALGQPRVPSEPGEVCPGAFPVSSLSSLFSLLFPSPETPGINPALRPA